MKWKIGIVANTSRTTGSETEGDEECTMGIITPASSRTSRIKQGNDPNEVRPVSAAVRALFGPTPEFWVQYQLLQLEKQIRFDRHHVFDFQEINYLEWAEVRWGSWLKEDSNRAFKEHFDKQSPGAQEALLDLVLEPFELMHQIANELEFDPDNVGVYTYLSVSQPHLTPNPTHSSTHLHPNHTHSSWGWTGFLPWSRCSSSCSSQESLCSPASMGSRRRLSEEK